MAKIYSIANHKGGVGKTSSTANIGKALSLQGKKVLLIDTDAQANLTTIFLTQQPAKTIYDSFVKGESIKDTIVNISDNLDLVPSSILFSGAEYEVSARVTRELIMKKMLAPIKNDYDYIIIDCPPSLGIITSNAFVASDKIFIPLVGETLPMVGLQMLSNIIVSLKEINEKLSIGGIFVTRYNNRKLNNVITELVSNNFGDLLMKTKIRECISIAEAPLSNQTIYDYDPESNGAADYTELVKEIMSKE